MQAVIIITTDELGDINTNHNVHSRNQQAMLSKASNKSI